MRLFVLLWSEKYHHVHASFISIVRPLFAQAQPTAGQPPTCPAEQLCLVPFTGSCAALRQVCGQNWCAPGSHQRRERCGTYSPTLRRSPAGAKPTLQSAHIASVRLRSGFRLVPPQRAGMLLQWCGAIIRWVSVPAHPKTFWLLTGVPLLPNYLQLYVSATLLDA